MSESMQMFSDVISITLGTLLITMLIAWCILMMIETEKTKQKRQDYIKKLDNDHDKAVIMDYKNEKWTLRKKNKK